MTQQTSTIFILAPALAASSPAPPQPRHPTSEQTSPALANDDERLTTTQATTENENNKDAERQRDSYGASASFSCPSPSFSPPDLQPKREKDIYLSSLKQPSDEEFHKISHEQARREIEHQRSPPCQHSYGGVNASTANQQTQDGAARLIQRTYRGYKTRRELEGRGLSASKKWAHTVKDAKWGEATRPKPKEKESPLQRRARAKWKLASSVAKYASGDQEVASPGLPTTRDDDDDLFSSSSSLYSSYHGSEGSHAHQSTTGGCDGKDQQAHRDKRKQGRKVKRKEEAKAMGLQYFLEMVDVKHRYGSNLRTYHAEWQQRDTKENFFYWLDYGEGKDADLEACPRERLDRDMVRYLSKDERQYYLVEVDNEGRLCWKKNSERVDTSEGYRDSVKGIVRKEDETETWRSPYAKGIAAGGRLNDKDVSAVTAFYKLLRRSVKKNVWIFVADTDFRLYVGIKNSGAFQHSSFLQGGRIAAAGSVKVKDGQLRGLSPLSGHYRPPVRNFRVFTKDLREKGVDMGRVSISKAYAVLAGLEMYVKTRRKVKKVANGIWRSKTRLLDPELAKEMEEAEMDGSQSAKREREVLEMEEMQREENKAGVKLLRTLNIRLGELRARRLGSGRAM